MTKEDLQFKFGMTAFMDEKEKNAFICTLMSMAVYAHNIASYMETADNGGKPFVKIQTVKKLGNQFKTKLDSIE